MVIVLVITTQCSCRWWVGGCNETGTPQNNQINVIGLVIPSISCVIGKKNTSVSPQSWGKTLQDEKLQNRIIQNVAWSFSQINCVWQMAGYVENGFSAEMVYAWWHTDSVLLRRWFLAGCNHAKVIEPVRHFKEDVLLCTNVLFWKSVSFYFSDC